MSLPDGRKTRRRATLAAGVLAALLVAGIVIAVNVVPDRLDSMASEDPPIEVEAVLDGTYQLDFDGAERRVNGTVSPVPQDDSMTWAFRSTCTAAKGCAAMASSLDDGGAHVLHYVNSSWETLPTRTQTDLQSWTMQPQDDGSLRGQYTETVVAEESASAGVTTQIPFVATRTGDVSADVAVGDPAEAPAPASEVLEVAGPKLAGTYRFTTDGTVQRWQAFRSVCTESGCVAIGVVLDGEDHQRASADVDVLRFVGDRWELRDEWWMVPQADGTLRGVREHPFVATREGAAPSSVVIADPIDFQ